MSEQQVDEFDYMADEHDVADFIDEVDGEFYARDDGNIGMEEYDLVSSLSSCVSSLFRLELLICFFLYLGHF